MGIVPADMVCDEAQSAAIQGQSKFAFRMMMPFKRNLRNLPVEDSDRAACGDRYVFELRSHE